MLKKHLFRVCVLGASFLMIFVLSHLIVTAKPQNKSAKHIQELIHKRTANNKWFENEDGSTTMCFSNAPLHYQNDQGQWEEIDTNLEKVTGEADDDGEPFGFKVVKNSFKSYFPRRSKGWVTLRLGESSLGFKLVTKNENRLYRKDKSGVSVTEIFDNCDLNYTVEQGLLKEGLIFKTKAVPQSFQYLVRAQNLTMVKNDTGGFIFKDSQDKPAYEMTPFVMYDAKGTTSDDIQVELKEEGKYYRLTITPSAEWLNDPERTYPVVLDPTFYHVNLNADIHHGEHAQYVMYIPCSTPAGYPDYSSTGSIYNINTPASLAGYTRNYYIPVTLVAHASKADSSIHNHNSSPWIQVTKYDGGDLAATYVSTTSISRETTQTFNFNIDPNYGAKIIMETGHYDMLGRDYGYDCWFEVTYSLDTTAPPAPIGFSVDGAKTINNTIYTKTFPVKLIWNQVIDSGSPASGIDRYTIMVDGNEATKRTVSANQYLDYAPYLFSSNKSYTVSITAIDKEGLSSAPTSYSFILDTIPPIIQCHQEAQ